MQKYKYALDLEENIYSLNSDFDTYKLSSDEIKKIRSEPISDKDSRYIDRKIVYDHTYIYLTPGDFIEPYKLRNNQKIELYDDIGKIKIKDITPENSKDISFILHHILIIRAQEDYDVHGYEMSISSSWQYIPFNLRMNFSIENIFNRQDKAINTQKELNNRISSSNEDKLLLSEEATNILKYQENKVLNSFYSGLPNFTHNERKNNEVKIAQNELFNNFTGGKKDNSEAKNNTEKYPMPPDPIRDLEDYVKIPEELRKNFPYNFSPVSSKKIPTEALNDINVNINYIKQSAKITNIDPAFLTGILFSERLRINYIQDYIGDHFSGETKGFSQISIASALEGQRHYCEKHNIPFSEAEERKDIEKNIFSDKNWSDAKNIEYASKYIDFLRDQFPLSHNLTQEDQNRLVAAAYKMGPETIKTARIQQQLNDLANANLKTDGYYGNNTNKIIYDILTSNKELLNKNDRFAKDIERLTPPDTGDMNYKDLYHQSDYEVIRTMINTLWARKHPGEYNPPGAVPNNQDKLPAERVDYHLHDVFEGIKLYNNNMFNF